MASGIVLGSFRDPSGFVFTQDQSIYRQVNTSYKDNYNHLIESGLYKALVDGGLLIGHEEVGVSFAKTQEAYKVIKPEPVGFISYPYEWSFSQLKDAALTTLAIQKQALEFGASLKDCSAYNIQFKNGQPVLIDTLSFERYREGEPWVAYKQFCQHFLAPLALMSYRDIRLNQLLRVYLDGIPLDLASRLLSLRTYARFFLLLHIHIHAVFARHAKNSVGKISRQKTFTIRSFHSLVDSLEASVKRMTWFPKNSNWVSYYADRPSYGSGAIEHKKNLVAEFVEIIKPKTVWDLGANTGLFSRIAGDRGIQTISFDMDPACVELNYLASVARNEKNILPLMLDLTNPSAKIGWDNEERMSLFERGPADLVLAVALVHHLAMTNNLPLRRIANFFSKIGRSLVIEFVPKSDPMVQEMLKARVDIFPDYTMEKFEKEFEEFFVIQKTVRIKDSERTLYLMLGKSSPTTGKQN